MLFGSFFCMVFLGGMIAADGPTKSDHFSQVNKNFQFFLARAAPASDGTV